MDVDKRNYINVFTECKNIFEEKRKKYGDSWRMLRAPSHVDIVLMKFNRLAALTDAQNYSDMSKQRLKSIRDQLIDTINYCNYMVQRVDEELNIKRGELNESNESSSNKSNT